MITTVNAVDLAMAVALQYHNGQTNKHDGEAYITHVHRVAMHVRDRGLDDAHQAVAWLHDTLEDTDLTINTLNAAFPPEIVAAVVALTKPRSPAQSNEVYYQNLTQNPIAARVKISDIVDNFSRNHKIEDNNTRLRMAAKYSLGLDILKEFV